MQENVFLERDLAPGEGKTKVALLSWSSGTTGNPKVKISYSWASAAIIVIDNRIY